MDNKDRNVQRPPRSGSNLIIWFLIALGIVTLMNPWIKGNEKPTQEITYAKFFGMLKDNSSTHAIKSCYKTDSVLRGELSTGDKFIVNTPDNDQDLVRLLRENIKDFDIKPLRTFWSNILYYLGPTVLLILFLWMFAYRSPGGGAGGAGRIWSFGKSRAVLASGESLKITFENVAGVDEAKEELKEIIEFLKDPKKFQKLGGKIPKGVLVMGPPGTGKTLLAKAVAGEANVPFFSISGSDFVEMFVGVGASRVRDLFDQAKRSAKQSGRGAIIFMDEIDAVGRQRFAGIGGGHDEREQTLNALLVEMDGFNSQEGVILIAATNRPDVLDPALLRPGRFDRQVVIDRPDIVGREAILKVHVKSVKVDPDVDLNSLAKQTPGFSGADLANLINEGALLAARRNKETVTMEEMQESIERVMAGPERKSRVISKKEKEVISYHESGHALLALLIPGAAPLHKVTILPRGMALGYTMLLPTEDRYIKLRNELLGEITGLLGGRASEELIFNEFSTGARNDLEVATDIARKMVMRWGMSGKLGSRTFGHREEQIFLGRDIIEEKNYSDQTALMIDQEVARIMDECYARAKDELLKHKDRLVSLAVKLLDKEVMEVEEVKSLLGFAKDEPAASV